MAVNFFNEEVAFELLHADKLEQWVEASVKEEGFKAEGISFIFCSDDYLLEMNVQYLQHDTYTDVITFDNSIEEDNIMGDIFISIDRIKENALKFGVTFERELHRVMIHGVLHLCGYEDKAPEDKQLMTEREDYYLSKFVL